MNWLKSRFCRANLQAPVGLRNVHSRFHRDRQWITSSILERRRFRLLQLSLPSPEIQFCVTWTCFRGRDPRAFFLRSQLPPHLLCLQQRKPKIRLAKEILRTPAPPTVPLAPRSTMRTRTSRRRRKTIRAGISSTLMASKANPRMQTIKTASTRTLAASLLF
jgi:hypothetical protein